MSHPETLELIPLGGLGQFGMNSMLYRIGDDAILIDAGMMFPGSDEPGVDRILPDFSPLNDCGTLHGVIATHGHEDHIGAIPDLLSRHSLPIIATRYTTELIRRKLRGSTDAEFVRLTSEPTALGPFTIEALPCPHSIPGTCMIVLHTPAGCVVHTADFKLDPDSPDGVVLDLDRLDALGDAGVLALLSDSTNADRPGTTPGERSIEPAFESILAESAGRVVVTTFASHALRLRLLGQLAARHGRHLALLGSAMETHADLAESQGQLVLPGGTRISNDRLMHIPPGRLLIAASGSQGEPQSAMARIARNNHRQLQLEPDDVVVHSARIIPGNEKQIGTMFDNIARRDTRVIAAADAHVHVSGHGSAAELASLIERLRPQYLIPMHGEYRQLAAHARLACATGFPSERILMAESGDCIVVNRDEIFIDGNIDLRPRLIDSSGGELEFDTLRDRLRMAQHGVVIPIVECDGGERQVTVVTRGFVPLSGDGAASLTRQLQSTVSRTLDGATDEEHGSPELLGARIDVELNRLFRRETHQRPLVLSTVLER